MKKLSQMTAKKQRGQALVEFAMTVPITLTVLFAACGFALLFYAYVTMQLAVREGTNSIVHKPNQTYAQVEATVRSYIVMLDQSQVRIDIYPPSPSNWVSSIPIQVTGYYSISLPIQALGTIAFRTVSIMTME